MEGSILAQRERVSLGNGMALRLLSALEVLQARREAGELAGEDRERALCSNACLLARALEREEDKSPVFSDGRAVLAGHPDAEHYKLTGIPTTWYAQLRVDRILVEADGSRCLPLKYHRTFEPVMPPDAGLVIELAGLAALGRPAGEVLHGWREAGIDPVRTVDEALCAALLERGLSAARSEAPKLVLLNQADTPALQVQGEALVRRLEERGVEAYVTQLKESHIKC